MNIETVHAQNTINARYSHTFLLALFALAAVAIGVGFFMLFYGLNNGIADLFSFRQTQTALSAYWLAREPHAFAYITPVLGYPWSMPFRISHIPMVRSTPDESWRTTRIRWPLRVFRNVPWLPLALENDGE